MRPSRTFGVMLVVVVCFLSLAAVDRAQATVIHDFVEVFGVGCSGSSALDPGGTPVACTPTVSWDHTIDFDPSHLKDAILKITAEGIDAESDTGVGPEFDEVFVNGTSVGALTNQSFYVPVFNLQPGPGALPDITELTISMFDVTPFLISGVNTITVVVDPTNWVLEIETSELWLEVPEPATLALFSLGFAGLGFARRRRTH